METLVLAPHKQTENTDTDLAITGQFTRGGVVGKRRHAVWVTVGERSAGHSGRAWLQVHHTRTTVCIQSCGSRLLKQHTHDVRWVHANRGKGHGGLCAQVSAIMLGTGSGAGSVSLLGSGSGAGSRIRCRLERSIWGTTGKGWGQGEGSGGEPTRSKLTTPHQQRPRPVVSL